MDEFEVSMENQKTTVLNKEEQQLIQTHDDYYNPDAVAEWEEFLKSAHYGAVLPAGYLKVDKLQNDPTFCIQTSVHPLELEARCATLIAQFNSFKGISPQNRLRVSDLAYYNLAHEIAETEIWRGILNFRQPDTTSLNAISPVQKCGDSSTQDQLADANWHPVFGPNFVRPAPREPSLISWGSEGDLAAFRCEGTSARLTRAPTFGSSTASDREWVHNVVNGYMNVSDEWLVYDGAESTSIARSKSVISNCSALINHDHECTAPSNLLPASPVINLGPAPAATGIEYTGPNPSASLDQLLNDHVDAPVATDESDLKRASFRRAERHYLIIFLLVVIIFFGGSIAAIIGAFVFAARRGIL
ncbi:hypothetical protein BOTCAL_0024g00110 [Botryotinia calthae]|uniref:Uncharacterized protein n=1 Tax=Botryotinia calthae TaxID=38488 RepID=A0A4Y8DGH9_9HELO|nr:hypothetical protein BOTCAL_0024g00110 [Botryotinia calthae]